jgi:hypothetical protein
MSVRRGFPTEWPVGIDPTGKALEMNPIRREYSPLRSSLPPLNIDIVLLRIHTVSTRLLAATPSEIIAGLSYRRWSASGIVWSLKCTRLHFAKPRIAEAFEKGSSVWTIFEPKRRRR